MAIVDKYRIPLYEGSKVHFHDVLRQLIKNAFDSIEQEYLPSESIQGKIDRKWRKAWKSTVSSK